MENITSSKLFTTRQGTILLGVIAAIIAAIALVVYLNNYRNSVSPPPVSVLVAKKTIPINTSGDILAQSTSFYEVLKLPKDQVKTGAITDSSTLAGKVALTQINPNSQLTADQFGATSGSVQYQLGPNQRAVVVDLGSPQSVGGQIGAGSLVDVWVTSSAQASNGVSQPIAKLLFQNMYVLGINGANVTLRTSTPRQAGQLIYASSNDVIWLVLRPTIGTTPKPPVITAGAVTGG